jgi:hypothetical protein
MSTLTMLHLLELIKAGMLLHTTAAHVHVRTVVAENYRPNARADWPHTDPVI